MLSDGQVLGNTVTSASKTATAVAGELRRRILGGLYAPHSYLPPERTLAREIGRSRSTVAGALEILESEGWVVRSQGRGTRVLPPPASIESSLVCVVHSVEGPAGYTEQQGTEATRMLRGIQGTFSRLGNKYELVPATQCPSADVIHRRYGAALFIGEGNYQECICELERRQLPVVVANLEKELDVTATWVDHGKSTVLAVRLMVALGHQRIAFLGRHPHLYFYGNARMAYLEAMRQAGIPVDESLVVTVGPESGPFEAYYQAKSLLHAPDPPTAIVAARDVLAQGACQAATELGCVVGRDISIIGYDDCSWPTPDPYLTTFREPCLELGAVAAEMLLERVATGWRPPEKREIPSSLLIRRSVGPCVRGDDASAGAAVARNWALELRNLESDLINGSQ